MKRLAWHDMLHIIMNDHDPAQYGKSYPSGVILAKQYRKLMWGVGLDDAPELVHLLRATINFLDGFEDELSEIHKITSKPVRKKVLKRWYQDSCIEAEYRFHDVFGKIGVSRHTFRNVLCYMYKRAVIDGDIWQKLAHD